MTTLDQLEHDGPTRQIRDRPRRKMTDDDVTRARRLYWSRQATQTELASALGVGQTTIRTALMRLTYRELPYVDGEPNV